MITTALHATGVKRAQTHGRHTAAQRSAWPCPKLPQISHGGEQLDYEHSKRGNTRASLFGQVACPDKAAPPMARRQHLIEHDVLECQRRTDHGQHEPHANQAYDRQRYDSISLNLQALPKARISLIKSGKASILDIDQDRRITHDHQGQRSD